MAKYGRNSSHCDWLKGSNIFGLALANGFHNWVFAWTTWPPIWPFVAATLKASIDCILAFQQRPSGDVYVQRPAGEFRRHSGGSLQGTIPSLSPLLSDMAPRVAWLASSWRANLTSVCKIDKFHSIQCGIIIKLSLTTQLQLSHLHEENALFQNVAERFAFSTWNNIGIHNKIRYNTQRCLIYCICFDATLCWILTSFCFHRCYLLTFDQLHSYCSSQ